MVGINALQITSQMPTNGPDVSVIRGAASTVTGYKMAYHSESLSHPEIQHTNLANTLPLLKYRGVKRLLEFDYH
jgi:hypothetical protein